MRTVLTLLLTLTLTQPSLARPKPKIAMAEAKATALKRMPGKLKSAELETEKGKLVYSFDIITDAKKIMEVQIDAMTGEVVEIEEETPEHEKREEQADRKRVGKK